MPTSKHRRGMKTVVAHKSYGATLPMNQGKLGKLLQLLTVWRNGLTYSLNKLVRELFENGCLSTWQNIKSFPSYLSQRQWDSVSRQAKAALDSWLTNRQNDFRRIVASSTLDDTLKHELYSINLRYAWYERMWMMKRITWRGG